METERKEAYKKALHKEEELRSHLEWQRRQLARLDLASYGYAPRLALVEHYKEKLRLATIERIQLQYTYANA